MRLMQWVVALAMAGAAMAFALAGAAKAQEAPGEWHGMLSAGGIELRIGITITAGPDGALAGTLTSPDQGAAVIPMGAVTLEGGKLTLVIPRIRGRYEGTWDSAQQAWVGVFTQAAPLPLTLVKGPPVALRRPQTPQKPYPYREVEVAFESAPDVTLAGTLTLPEGKGPFSAVAMITGSGPQDRDEYLLGHRPFLVIADELTRHGIAVLRYDDRGVAKSKGSFLTATSADFAVDAEAAAAFLRTRPEIDPRKVGLIGHSEGGMIAPLVAAADPKIAFVVLMAGPGVPTRELMRAQREAITKVMGGTPAVIAANAAAWDRVEDALLTAKDWPRARARMKEILLEAYTKAGVPAEPAAKATDAALLQVGTPWYKYFIGFDPGPTLSKLRVPVLAINGDKDLQVVSSQNLPAIRAALKGHKDVTIVELPGLNHLFQTSATGDPREYGKIEETIAPAALHLMSSWIVAHTKH